jgi:cytochrome c-type biogenesis protein CcmH/NrfG
MLALAGILVVGVAAISWSVNYLVVDAARDAGKLKADSLAAAQKQPQEADPQRARKEELLVSIEKALVERPTDSMLVISAANVAYDLKRFDVAVRHYKVFLGTIDPDNIAARIDYGYAVFSAGNQQEGIAIVEAVVRRDPSNQTALYNLAMMAFQMDKVDDGTQWLDRCIKAGPDTPIGERAARTLQAVRSAS